MRLRHILFDLGAGGGGGGGDQGAAFLQTLPEDLRTNASIAKFKTGEELARGYVNAQQLIGTKRLEAPQPTWTEKEWGQLYDTLGRPSDLAKYSIPPDVKLPESVKLDDAKMAEVRRQFHALGLTETQGSKVLGLYASSLAGTVQATEAARKAETEKAMADLRATYGGELDAKLDSARLAVEKLGGDELKQALDSTGFGNNAAFIKTLVKIGEMMQEDSTSGGSGSGNMSSAQQQAADQIALLRQDSKFIEALTTQHHPGHRDAVVKWQNLHAAAFPGKTEG